MLKNCIFKYYFDISVNAATQDFNHDFQVLQDGFGLVISVFRHV